MNSLVIYAVVAFVAAILSGVWWSRYQRLKSVRESYQAIVEEVRRERESGEETVTIISWSR
jgi:FtsZ-interacting cell division protein ZipA